MSDRCHCGGTIATETRRGTVHQICGSCHVCAECDAAGRKTYGPHRWGGTVSGPNHNQADRPHWFADVDQDAPESHRWQPCLEAGGGHVPCFEVWFPTRESCEDWIRDVVIGAPLEVSS